MSNAFDMVRKIRHLPGLQLKATVDPTQISKRIKNAAKLMLRSGVLVGGHSSQSRTLAEQVMDTFNQPAVGSATSWGAFVREMAMVPKAKREQLVELLNASRLIEHANGGNASYVNPRYDRMVEIAKTTRTGKVSFNAYNKAMNIQIMEFVSSLRAPEQVAAHAALADRLDDPKPFVINIYE